MLYVDVRISDNKGDFNKFDNKKAWKRTRKRTKTINQINKDSEAKKEN